MVNIKAVVLSHQRRADGTFNVKIRLTFKGRVAYLPTTITAHPEDLTRSLKFRPGNALMKAQELTRSIDNIVADISPMLLPDWDIKDVVAFISERQKQRTFSLNFIEYAYQWIRDASYSEGTKRVHTTAVNHLREFAGDELDINAISKQMLTEFYDTLISPHSIRTTHVCLARIFNDAAKKYNDEDRDVFNIPRHPFSNFPLPKYFPKGQQPLTVEQVQRLIDFKTDNVFLRRTADIALISFAFMGMNASDIYYAKAPADGIVSYNRRKTVNRRADHALMRVKVPACIAPVLTRSCDPNGEFLIAHRYASIAYFNGAVTTFFPKVCEAAGLPRFTMYAIRKAWATIARSLGVEKALVDECLSHVGDFRMTDIYAQRDFKRMWEANEKVLSLFNWDNV